MGDSAAAPMKLTGAEEGLEQVAREQVVRTLMRGLLVAKGEEVAELGLGADRLELTKGNQTATPFPILPGFWPHISVVFTISSSNVNIL